MRCPRSPSSCRPIARMRAWSANAAVRGAAGVPRPVGGAADRRPDQPHRRGAHRGARSCSGLARTRSRTYLAEQRETLPEALEAFEMGQARTRGGRRRRRSRPGRGTTRTPPLGSRPEARDRRDRRSQRRVRRRRRCFGRLEADLAHGGDRAARRSSRSPTAAISSRACAPAVPAPGRGRSARSSRSFERKQLRLALARGEQGDEPEQLHRADGRQLHIGDRHRRAGTASVPCAPARPTSSSRTPTTC